MKKNNFLFSRYLDFCFCEIHKVQNLWHHHKHCYIMEVTLMLISFESLVLSFWLCFSMSWEILNIFWWHFAEKFMVIVRWLLSKTYVGCSNPLIEDIAMILVHFGVYFWSIRKPTNIFIWMFVDELPWKIKQ